MSGSKWRSIHIRIIQARFAESTRNASVSRLFWAFAAMAHNTDRTMTNQLHDWHDFYLLIGTASATLVGLMFVAASIGTRFFDEAREPAVRLFLTPTVSHFSAILVTCLAATAPSHTRISLAILFFAGGAAGVGYTATVWIRMRRRGFITTLDVADRLGYILFPGVGYLLMIGSGITLLLRADLGLDMLAATLVFLLLLGIRNAWDMTLWVMLRTPNQE